MKVALVGPTFPFRGGISHYTTLLYRHLRRRHDTRFYAFQRQYPTWLFPGRGDRDPSASRLEEPGAERVLDGFNPLTFARLGWQLRSTPPDLLILPWWVVFWAPHYLALFASCPRQRVLFLVHNVLEHEDHRAKQVLTRLVLSRGTHALVHSAEEEERLRRLVPSLPVTRAFHPTYEELAPPAPAPAQARAEVAAELGVSLPPDAPTALFFGFVRPYKGLDDLLEALPAARPDLRLLIVGEFWGDTRRAVEARLATLGLTHRVFIHDQYVPNEAVGRYFAAADVVVLPYRSGSGSGILQVAFGHRRPVIATRTGSLADAVRDGATGLLVPPADPPALAAAIDRFFELRGRVPFADQVDRDVRERFGWDALIDILETIPQRSAP